jgi:outer membrane protein TolC
MRQFFNFLVLFFLFAPLFGQTTVTIEECQDWAISHSSANVQKELNTQLLKVKLNDASSHLYPRLEINGGLTYQSHVPQLPVSTFGVDSLSKLHSFIALDFSQTVFDGAKFFYGRKYEKLLNEAEIFKLDISINQLKEKVISIYLNLFIIEKQLVILSNAEENLNEQVNRLKIMLKEGVVYANAVDQLEVEVLKIEQQKGELQATKESLISSLSILTGKDLSNVVFAVPVFPTIEENTNSSRYEFKIFENKKKSLDYQKKLHFSQSLPKLSVFVTAGYGRPTYDIFSNKFDWFYLTGVKLKIPLIDWAKTTGIGNIINLQKSIVASQEADFEKSNKIAIQEKLNEIKKIENLLLLDEKITQKYKDITQTVSTQLLNGTITAYDFIKYKNNEVQSLISQEVHHFQLLKAKYELLGLKGKL